MSISDEVRKCCPFCGGVGYTIIEGSDHWPEQEECQYCYEVAYPLADKVKELEAELEILRNRDNPEGTCARQCEATAYKIQIRALEAELTKKYPEYRDIQCTNANITRENLALKAERDAWHKMWIEQGIINDNNSRFWREQNNKIEAERDRLRRMLVNWQRIEWDVMKLSRDDQWAAVHELIKMTDEALEETA